MGWRVRIHERQRSASEEKRTPPGVIPYNGLYGEAFSGFRYIKE